MCDGVLLEQGPQVRQAQTAEKSRSTPTCVTGSAASARLQGRTAGGGGYDGMTSNTSKVTKVRRAFLKHSTCKLLVDPSLLWLWMNNDCKDFDVKWEAGPEEFVNYKIFSF